MPRNNNAKQTDGGGTHYYRPPTNPAPKPTQKPVVTPPPRAYAETGGYQAPVQKPLPITPPWQPSPINYAASLPDTTAYTNPDNYYNYEEKTFRPDFANEQRLRYYNWIQATYPGQHLTGVGTNATPPNDAYQLANYDWDRNWFAKIGRDLNYEWHRAAGLPQPTPPSLWSPGDSIGSGNVTRPYRMMEDLQAQRMREQYAYLFGTGGGSTPQTNTNEPRDSWIGDPNQMFQHVVINGRTYSVPTRNLTFAIDYPWETQTHWYEPPAGWVNDGNWKEIRGGTGAMATEPPGEGGEGGGEGGGGGGGGYTGGGGGYDYDTKPGYGYGNNGYDMNNFFSRLVKWVI